MSASVAGAHSVALLARESMAMATSDRVEAEFQRKVASEHLSKRSRVAPVANKGFCIRREVVDQVSNLVAHTAIPLQCVCMLTGIQSSAPYDAFGVLCSRCGS